ncbi:branched-chain amino acid ABC transporter permease [Bradyrhizobium viridifuturi]|uniref:branched-chain amino acid ABC transporter permease n=1 Tax=Bradyrhizobium viridifuturi TaxID=1654716 RepID=UPI00067F0E48|nr:branched-chain amino acid ABC transporter permease [Bradyrhizobium viridifuturi]
MNTDVALILLQDGLVNGAIYTLLATALVLVFSVTRVIFVPQGDLVAFTALTLSAFEAGQRPGTVWIVAFAAAGALSLEMIEAARQRDRARAVRSVLRFGVIPAVVILALFLVPKSAPLFWKMAVSAALITCLGALIYRIVFQPMAAASPLVLLIAAIATHLGLNSIGLHVFGPEGVRTEGFSGSPLALFGMIVTSQAAGVLASSVVVVAALYIFFRFSLRGRALLAAAHNRRGAEIVGISTVAAGRTVFVLAGLAAAVSGLLVGPTTTLYYDSGFILGLKGFVGAIVGGMAVFPLAAAGALLVGTVEAFASFWASAYRDVIVFLLIIPVLFWRSVSTLAPEDGLE